MININSVQAKFNNDKKIYTEYTEYTEYKNKKKNKKIETNIKKV